MGSTPTPQGIGVQRIGLRLRGSGGLLVSAERLHDENLQYTCSGCVRGFGVGVWLPIGCCGGDLDSRDHRLGQHHAQRQRGYVHVAPALQFQPECHTRVGNLWPGGWFGTLRSCDVAAAARLISDEEFMKGIEIVGVTGGISGIAEAARPRQRLPPCCAAWFRVPQRI